MKQTVWSFFDTVVVLYTALTPVSEIIWVQASHKLQSWIEILTFQKFVRIQTWTFSLGPISNLHCPEPTYWCLFITVVCKLLALPSFL